MRVQSVSEQSPLSLGIAWAYRVSAIGFAFVVPALIGFWIDQQFDSRPWATLLGALIGFGAGMLMVLRIAVVGSQN